MLKFIDLKAGRDSGRLYRIAPDGFRFRGQPRLSTATTAELVALLEHSNGWHRDTAHRLLFERQDKSAVPLLAALLRRSSMPQARLCALWSLEGLRSLETAELEAALADPHASLREHAVRLSEPHLRDDAILQKVIALVEDPNPRVRMQVAYSLGETKDPRAVDAIARIARRDGGDPWIRMAVLSSVAETSDELLIRLLSDRAFVASSTGAEMAEKLAYIVGVRNRLEEIGKLLDAVTELHGTQDVAALQTQIVQGVGDGLKQVNGFLPFDGGFRNDLVHGSSIICWRKQKRPRPMRGNGTATGSPRSGCSRALRGAFRGLR